MCYNQLLLLILMHKMSQIWPVRVPSSWLWALTPFLPHPLSTSLLSGPIGLLHPSLHFPVPTLDAATSARRPGPTQQNVESGGFRNQDLGH